jgi:hypothetical protein
LHSAAARLNRSHGSNDLLAAVVAKGLARLYCCTASVAEHVSSSHVPVSDPNVSRNNRNKILSDR